MIYRLIWLFKKGDPLHGCFGSEAFGRFCRPGRAQRPGPQGQGRRQRAGFRARIPAGKYCATDDEAAIEAGLRVVNNTLADNFVRPEEGNKAQALVKEQGRHAFIDKVKVRYLAEDDKYWAELVNFGHKYVHVPERLLRDYDRLLMGGIWAQVEIRHEYDEDAKGKRSPFWIEKLTPIQLATFDLSLPRGSRAVFHPRNGWMLCSAA